MTNLVSQPGHNLLILGPGMLCSSRGCYRPQALRTEDKVLWWKEPGYLYVNYPGNEHIPLKGSWED